MLERPPQFKKLSPSYLFPEINRRKEALRSIMLEQEGIQPDNTVEEFVVGQLSPDAKIDLNALYNASSDMQTFF